MTDNSNIILKLLGHAVAQLVEALRYKLEGRGFDSRWCDRNVVMRRMTLFLCRECTLSVHQAVLLYFDAMCSNRAP
jgi:hypothetical protein